MTRASDELTGDATGRDLSTALATLNLTREEFAAHVNVNPRTVRRWLAGDRVPELVAREVRFMLAEMKGQ